MKNSEKLERYFIQLRLDFEALGKDNYLIQDKDNGLENVMVILEEPVVMIRINLMGLPQKNKDTLFEKVLRLNGEDMLYGFYAIEGDKLIMLSSHLIDTFDQEELQATLDSMSLAITQHYPVLAEFKD